MDLAKQPDDSQVVSRLLGWIILGANIWLVYHLIIFVGKTSFEAGLGEYTYLRNMFYLGYALLLGFFGILTILGYKEKVQNFIPRIVIGLILTTFAYALVGVAIDSYYWLIRLLAN
ncbi:MAG: hypothetical protein HYS86_00350 [Candidatus Chisholmbacteria bacterium]|nr:hypothetical protein [Candidatus Chisholmbacteria bacterium]